MRRWPWARSRLMPRRTPSMSSATTASTAAPTAGRSRHTTGVPLSHDSAEIRLVDRGRDDEQRHHPPFDHRRDDLRLTVGAVPRRCRENEAIAATDRRLDPLQHARPERIADAGRDDADHRRDAAGAQQAGELVGTEAELGSGAADSGNLLRAHVALVVEGAVHRLRGDTGETGDVASRRRPPARSGAGVHVPPAWRLRRGRRRGR